MDCVKSVHSHDLPEASRVNNKNIFITNSFIFVQRKTGEKWTGEESSGMPSLYALCAFIYYFIYLSLLHKMYFDGQRF